MGGAELLHMRRIVSSAKADSESMGLLTPHFRAGLHCDVACGDSRPGSPVPERLVPRALTVLLPQIKPPSEQEDSQQ